MNDKIKSNTAIICLSPYHGGMEIDAYKMTKMLSNFISVTLILKKGSFLEKEYKTNNPYKVISESVDWAEERLIQLKKTLNNLYPWRV